ncbi:MAG: hypothetical protein JW755_00100, partial [Candidatus Aminicenantes bacterium]|nr:hypothetical protein [Candidatus Aminicenantes bacterium]
KGDQMRRTMKLTSLAVLMVFAGLSILAQEPGDMVGAWAGTATLEGESEPNELTLVLELEDGNLTGHMTDQYGAFNENSIEEILLENGSFNFTVKVESPQGMLTIKFTMKVEGDSMQGTLEVEEMGASGIWEATKQK